MNEKLELHINEFKEFANATAEFVSTLMRILDVQKETNYNFHDQLASHLASFKKIQEYIDNLDDLLAAYKSIVTDHEQRLKNLEDIDSYGTPIKLNKTRAH